MPTLELPRKLGNYLLLQLLGRGGMGEVFLAEDLSSQQKFAIKVLRGDMQDSADLRTRFHSEVRATTALDHPNIVSVFEVGETVIEADHLPYLVMEYVQGQSLEQILENNRLPVKEALNYSLQIVEGLQAAHKLRIIHRDVKPSNIMITSHDRVKLLDFGLSKQLYDGNEESSTQIKNTNEGTIIGTIGYLSPEQALGKKIDERSDIFSFGVVFYQMLTGEHPFPGANSVERLAKIVTQDPEPWPPVSRVPSSLKKIVQRCLQKDPKDRYTNISALHKELASAQEQLNLVTSLSPEHSLEPNSDQPTLIPSDAPTRPQTFKDPGSVLAPTTSKRKYMIGIYLALILIFVSAMGGLVLSKFRTKEVLPLKTSQLTISSGLDIFPCYSPDGSKIVYASDRTGNFEIYVKTLTLGTQEQQLTKDNNQNIQPVWSPDGTKIAYYSKTKGGICEISAQGGESKQLTSFGSYPAWSRDGRYLAFQSDPVNDLSASAFAAMPPSTIWVLDLNGGTPKQITQPSTLLGGHGAPTWSPDGKKIAFVVYDRHAATIYTIERDGGTPIKMTSNEIDCYDPVYAQDSSALYYCGVTRTRDYGLWKQPLDKAGLPVGDAKLIINLGVGAIRQPSISPDGKRLVYTALSLSSNLWSINIKDGLPLEMGKGTHSNTLTRDTSRNSRPAFSPDGSKIAFNRFMPGGNLDIWVMDKDGNNGQQLTTDPALDLLPSWFPGGDRIGFLSNRDGSLAFWAITLANKQEALIMRNKDPEIDYPVLSPDGKRVAFTANREGKTNIWLVDLNGGPARQITFDEEFIGFPCWSPDGRWLALQLKRGDNTYAAVVAMEGGDIKQLTTEEGQSWPNSWSPDGDRIVFAATRNGFWNIWWVSRSTGKQQQITDFHKLNAYVRYPAWSPKDDQIVYEYAETTGNIWMIENLP